MRLALGADTHFPLIGVNSRGPKTMEGFDDFFIRNLLIIFVRENLIMAGSWGRADKHCNKLHSGQSKGPGDLTFTTELAV